MRYTYSYRRAGEDGVSIDPDLLLDLLADELIASGDAESVLKRLLRQGINDEQGAISGLDHLLKDVRTLRQEEQERYDLDSLASVLTRRAPVALHTDEGALADVAQRFVTSLDHPVYSVPASASDSKQQTLDQLRELDRSEFSHSSWGHADRDEPDSLQQAAVERCLQDVSDVTGRGGSNRQERLCHMLSDLNLLLEEESSDGTRFDQFMEEHGSFFPTVNSLQNLIDHLARAINRSADIVNSLPTESRNNLQEILCRSLRHPVLRREADRIQRNLRTLPTSVAAELAVQVAFSHESVALDDRLQLLRRIQDLEELERQLAQARERGNVEEVSTDLVVQLLQRTAADDLERLKNVSRALENAGYISRNGSATDLTPRGIRKIGEKALRDIFRSVKHDRPGMHLSKRNGLLGVRGDTTKPYEFGDPFVPDLTQSLLNAVGRQGAAIPLRLNIADFEIFAADQQTLCATVLLLDMSHSMPLRGCFVAAKKIAFALHSLIRTHFRVDRLFIVGFSDFAQELQPDSLQGLSLGECVYGTNMQHAFMLARRLLARHHNATRQIILITDGEPTAHFEGTQLHVAYPPTPRTLRETLAEVRRCTRDGIVINTFMLARSQYLTEFVDEMTRINGGRTFYTAPENLGEYVLVDYVNTKNGTLRPDATARGAFRR